MSTDYTQDEVILQALLAAPGSEESASLQSRIDVDPVLRSRANELRSMLVDLGSLGKEGALFSVSAEQRRRLLELWPKARRPLADRVRTAVEEFVASLTFDSLRVPAAVGVRGPSDARILRLRCDQACIDLRIGSGKPGEALNIAGQIDSARRFDTVIARGVDDASPITSNVESDGYFEMRLAQGRYGLRFEGPDLGVVIDAIDVAASAGE